MTRKYVDDRGRLTNLRVRGGDGSSIALAERYQTGSLSFSTSAVGQVSLTLREDGAGFQILRSGLFTPANGLGASVNDGALDLDDLRLTIASTATADRGRDVDLAVEARSAGAVRMTANTEASTLTQVTPATWVRLKAEALGMRAVVKDGGAVYQQVGNESKDGKPDDTWTTAQKLAKDLGYWAFEAAGVFYFGPPTWLVTQTPRRTYTWAAARAGEPRYTGNPLLRMPKFRRVSDAGEGVAATTVALELADTENDLLPGMGIDLPGVPGFEGTYIVTSVQFTLGPGARVQVQAEVPTDPIPGVDPSKYVRSEALTNAGQALTPSSSGGVGIHNPGAGRFGGYSLNADQVGNAVIIVQVAVTQRRTMPKAAVLALMCALQESKLRNLAGGDRDSVGLFQQRPSQGWGTVTQCRTATYAAGKFYTELARLVPAYATKATTTSMGDAIQKVQRSGYPRAYDQWREEAEALVAAILATGTTTVSAAAASTPASAGGQVEAFVQKCLAQAGDRYVFGAETRLADPDPNTFDCSELVEWACYQVGVKIADGSQNQRRACRAFRPLSIAQAMKTRGALVFTSGHVAISLGDGRTIEAKGRAYGVVVDVVGKRFVDAGLIPGMAGYQVAA